MKQRTGKECKKTDCIRHDSYKRWQPGDSNLEVCMQCKWAFVSQLYRKPNVKFSENLALSVSAETLVDFAMN